MFRTSSHLQPRVLSAPPRLLPGSAGAGYGMDPFTAAAASQAAASNLTEAMQAKLGLGAAWCPRVVCWMVWLLVNGWGLEIFVLFLS